MSSIVYPPHNTSLAQRAVTIVNAAGRHNIPLLDWNIYYRYWLTSSDCWDRGFLPMHAVIVEAS